MIFVDTDTEEYKAIYEKVHGYRESIDEALKRFDSARSSVEAIGNAEALAGLDRAKARMVEARKRMADLESELLDKIDDAE